jgi:peptidoglycan hydrolase CwlO-like protein
MKLKTLLLIAVMIFQIACNQTKPTENTNQPKNILTNSTSNTNSTANGNVFANLEQEREELLKKNANFKKELDELQKQAKNANVKTDSIHEKIHELETDVNAPRKK